MRENIRRTGAGAAGQYRPPQTPFDPDRLGQRQGAKSMNIPKEAIKNYFLNLQELIVSRTESLDGKSFHRDAWARSHTPPSPPRGERETMRRKPAPTPMVAAVFRDWWQRAISSNVRA
jgi:hypothetical protein